MTGVDRDLTGNKRKWLARTSLGAAQGHPVGHGAMVADAKRVKTFLEVFVAAPNFHLRQSFLGELNGTQSCQITPGTVANVNAQRQ